MNPTLKKFLAPAIVGMACAVGVAPVSADEGAVKYRKALMKAVAGHAGAIAGIAKGEVPHTAHLTGHAHALVEVSKLVGAAFKTESLAGKTTAIDKIWSDWGGFEGAAEEMVVASTATAKAAESGDLAAVGGTLKDLFATCKGCHKEYRKKKN